MFVPQWIIDIAAIYIVLSALALIALIRQHWDNQSPDPKQWEDDGDCGASWP